MTISKTLQNANYKKDTSNNEIAQKTKSATWGNRMKMSGQFNKGIIKL